MLLLVCCEFCVFDVGGLEDCYLVVITCGLLFAYFRFVFGTYMFGFYFLWFVDTFDDI